MPLLSHTTPAMLLFVLLVWTTSPSPTAAEGGLAGGWSSVEVTQNASTLLERALTNASSYRESVTKRVCVYEIRSLSQQVVSGMNYRYDVQACPVNSILSAGICAVKILTTTNASCGEYTIQLYEQSWTNTLQVAAIELVSTDVGADADANKTSSTQASSGTANSTTSSSNSSSSSDASRMNSSVVTPAPSATTAKSAAADALSAYSVVLALVSVMAFAASEW